MNTNSSAFRKAHLTRLAAGTLAGIGLAILAGPATAQPTEEITITAPRVVHEQVGRSPSTGAPIERISLTRQVDYSDLDLTKPADADELEKRVSDTAKEACKQLDSLYPLTPPDPTCIGKATDGGMAQAKAAIDAAHH